MSQTSKHASGAAKRKARKKLEELVKCTPKIDIFLKREGKSLPNVNVVDKTDDDTLDNTGVENERQRDVSSASVHLIDNCKPITGNSNEQENPTPRYVPETDNIVQSPLGFLENLSSELYPSEKVHFVDPISHQEKRFIISHGPCQPKGPFPRSYQQKGRCFSEAYYNTTNKAGVNLKCSWLCYSPTLDKVYCQACWLFSRRDSHNFVPIWVNGTNDWAHLSQRIEKHEHANVHMQCCVVLDQWRFHKTLTEEMEENITKEANFWRQVLERVINVSLTLAMSNLPFRGHRENTDSENRGNFFSVITLLAKYDPILEKLLSMPGGKGSTTYLSGNVQNEVITLLSEQVKQNIIRDIKEAPFFSVIMDTTQDVAKIDQLSQVIRYVTIVSNTTGSPKALKINESFIGFVQVKDQSAAGLEEEILNCMINNDLDLSKLRGQGYDGAANMSGVYSGVQARLKAKQKWATYVHCASHNLNLVLNDTMNATVEVKTFFDVVERIYVFFAHSIKRWQALASATSHMKTTLKKLSPTRWSSRHDSLTAIRYRYVDIIKCLTEIMLLGRRKEETMEATALKHQMEKFEFVFLLVFLCKVLEIVNVVSKLLQSSQEELSTAVPLLKTALSSMEESRNNYVCFFESAASLAKDWGVPDKFRERRVRSVKRFHDEISEDRRLSSPEAYFKINVFYPTIDKAIVQIRDRFVGLNDVFNTFEVIQPSTLSSSLTDEFLYTAAEKLAMRYDSDLSPSFPSQLISFRSCFKHEISKKSSVRELAELLILENSSLASTFTDICTACLLFMTIPVTVATAERSFSKLKLIKNYLRSTMSEERLSALALLSIENTRAREIDVSKAVDVFAEKKARKKRFN